MTTSVAAGALLVGVLAAPQVVAALRIEAVATGLAGRLAPAPRAGLVG